MRQIFHSCAQNTFNDFMFQENGTGKFPEQNVNNKVMI